VGRTLRARRHRGSSLAYLARNLPLTGRAAFAGLRQLDPSLEEAAASLGAGRARRLWSVTVPLIAPALAAGAALAFLTAFGDFVVSVVLYTFDTRPISVEILYSLRMQKTESPRPGDLAGLLPPSRLGRFSERSGAWLSSQVRVRVRELRR
jgi:ABC-type spermidine/putrescine transport system permease subunit II